MSQGEGDEVDFGRKQRRNGIEKNENYGSIQACFFTSRFEMAARADATTSSNCSWLLRSATAAGFRTRMNRCGRSRKNAKSSCSRKTRIMSLGKDVTRWPVAASFTF